MKSSYGNWLSLGKTRHKHLRSLGRQCVAIFTAMTLWVIPVYAQLVSGPKDSDSNTVPPGQGPLSYRRPQEPSVNGEMMAAFGSSPKIDAALTERAQNGDAKAQCELGVIYEKGNSTGVTRDNAEAVKWYRKAAEQGYSHAQNNLGIMYAQGKGVPKDYAVAMAWFEKAAKQNYAGAQNSLGLMYADGMGVAKDENEAVKWYRKAAEQGLAVAQNNLGLMYVQGKGVPTDYAAAMGWFEKAAQQSYSEAQNNLGKMYTRGLGVAEDETEAVKWYRKAAEQGLAEAQYLLGNRYASGKGINEDWIESAKWYREAAQKGLAPAQDALGSIYAIGKGVAEDNNEAEKWYRKAADQGFAPAQDNLAAFQRFQSSIVGDEQRAHSHELVTDKLTPALNERAQNGDANMGQIEPKKVDDFGPIFWVGVCAFLAVWLGTTLGLNKKLVVYCGTGDLAVACLVLITLAVTPIAFYLAPWLGWTIAVLNLILVAGSIGITCLANRSYPSDGRPPSRRR